ncbi:DoxX family membrane protein [bacterium]|nr:DoxX family membrane protein [bacterium]MBU1072308.1 DoxX family membrane protein [bacterium]MBU1677091.1 DoxX family membrane protein [bacterium]
MSEAVAKRGLILPDYLELLLRFLIGGTFVYASLDKILDPAAFAQAVSHYRILGADVLHPLALYLPWLELVAGLAMIMGFARRGAALLIALMTAMFMAAILAALARDLDISCGCFHTKGGHAVGLSLLLRDLALLAAAVILLLNRGTRRSF